jgi:hypothetical protein
MTPEELNRTIKFIVASQARMAAAQEQDRQNRFEFEDWAKRLMDDQQKLMDDQKKLMGRLARISDRQTELLSHQSERMDRLDKLHADWLVRNEDFQKQTLHLLNLILDRLPPRSVN